jgi:hypothetical protein
MSKYTLGKPNLSLYLDACYSVTYDNQQGFNVQMLEILR